MGMGRILRTNNWMTGTLTHNILLTRNLGTKEKGNSSTHQGWGP